MSEQGGFFQFPLCLLATRDPLIEWLPRAFDYGIVEFLRKTEPDFPHKSAAENDRCYKRAQEVIRFKGGTWTGSLAVHQDVQAAVSCFPEKIYEVRLKTEYFFDVLKGSMLPERDFRVLIGLYTVIGSKPFAKAGWPMIQARAAGHLSVGIPRNYRGPVYSRWQVEQAVLRLLDRKFLCSVTYNKGERFWSHRLSAEELAEAVKRKKTWMIQARQERAALSAKTSLAIGSFTNAPQS